MKRFLHFLTMLAALPALASIGSIVVLHFTSSGVALTAAAPTASSGHPLSGALAADAGYPLFDSYVPRAVWCELESNGTTTGGTLKWWKQSEQVDGGWGYAPGLDETIPNIATGRFVSVPVDISGSTGKVYCQPSAVTESGGDGGLKVVYGFRLEREGH